LSERMCSGTPWISMTSASVSMTPKLLMRRATVPINRARPSPASGNTARKSASTRSSSAARHERAEHADTLKFEEVSPRIIDNLKVEIEKVNCFSTYRVHHRVTGRFRKGRAFLLGDAAHIHSSAGGQGMNTGIGGAINLAWKLKTVLKSGAPDARVCYYPRVPEFIWGKISFSEPRL
jgi:2-polyprenyl-6-methoxyphenol hydroxylase-like FAD-dependent oxidoreductase